MAALNVFELSSVVLILFCLIPNRIQGRVIASMNLELVPYVLGSSYFGPSMTSKEKHKEKLI